MIAEWFIGIYTGMLEWFLELLPTDDPPEFLTSAPDAVETITQSAAGLGAWVPWSYLGIVASTILLLWGILSLVKGVRWLWGLTPFSGGS